ncbi:MULTISPECIES: TetR/AcrR family transcriptional regulator [Streptomyces]|uniref:TetR/AcrR family transcriptional regulator n=1 Tax=Streptomyces TaxID=1883 RepID=UPI00056AC0A3|nr:MULTISPECIES: TetR/AcrR family transcriptional regulator [Streptomyces]MBZ6114335.1 TetR/AcrR family transcriptional regulator [Streptomyces olivaceus]MBZ6128139.1 TetR/AcrR family transcriptional regulator [Streptomyces olivaceus]MBZ6149040.1 TetR/AcrR family transcriptional regulator [Streptomyces olivaceus]MBZ6162816.1 TetR/AcrR family transcriptional regulator [Streptomyces olivaceus]MBZ6190619.1 TetR/AcrR family transcriptional regulator [Streptomyces olivaceus]
MAEGLRERKKRQTRQYISDVATGLFLERGFEAVTVAEVADAADVSVNTVYNYFPAKEDLFLDRSEGVIDRLSRWVRGRREGESAARAVLRELREEVESVSPRVGLMDGYATFMTVVQDSAALRSRMWATAQEALLNLERTLREETGAAEDDMTPALMAGQINWLHGTVLAAIGQRMVDGGEPSEVSREVMLLLDEMEELLSGKVLNYAVRGAR